MGQKKYGNKKIREALSQETQKSELDGKLLDCSQKTLYLDDTEQLTDFFDQAISYDRINSNIEMMFMFRDRQQSTDEQTLIGLNNGTLIKTKVTPTQVMKKLLKRYFDYFPVLKLINPVSKKVNSHYPYYLRENLFIPLPVKQNPDRIWINMLYVKNLEMFYLKGNKFKALLKNNIAISNGLRNKRLYPIISKAYHLWKYALTFHYMTMQLTDGQKSDIAESYVNHYGFFKRIAWKNDDFSIAQRWNEMIEDSDALSSKRMTELLDQKSDVAFPMD